VGGESEMTATDVTVEAEDYGEDSRARMVI